MVISEYIIPTDWLSSLSPPLPACNRQACLRQAWIPAFAGMTQLRAFWPACYPQAASVLLINYARMIALPIQILKEAIK